MWVRAGGFRFGGALSCWGGWLEEQVEGALVEGVGDRRAGRRTQGSGRLGRGSGDGEEG